MHSTLIYFTKWNIDVPSKASILLTTCFTDNSTLPAICFSQDVWCDKYLKSNLAKRHRWMWHPRLSWELHFEVQGCPHRNLSMHTHKHPYVNTRINGMCITVSNISLLHQDHKCDRIVTSCMNVKYKYITIKNHLGMTQCVLVIFVWLWVNSTAQKKFLCIKESFFSPYWIKPSLKTVFCISSGYYCLKLKFWCPSPTLFWKKVVYNEEHSWEIILAINAFSVGHQERPLNWKKQQKQLHERIYLEAWPTRTQWLCSLLPLPFLKLHTNIYIFPKFEVI